MYLMREMNDSIISEIWFLKSKRFVTKQIVFSQYKYSLLYIILSSIFEKHSRTDIGLLFIAFPLSPPLNIRVIRAIFISFWKILQLKELLIICLSGSTIKLKTLLIALKEISLKLGLLLVFKEKMRFLIPYQLMGHHS